MTLVLIGTHDGPTSPRLERHASEVLRTAARRVATDLHMVQALCHKTVSGDGLSPEVRAAVREAFFLHVWSLREFFYGQRRPGLGVVASDFFGSAREWESVRPPLPPSLDADWHRAFDAVKPISKIEPRDDAPNARRPYRRFATELAALAGAFLDALPPDRASWFESRA